MLKLVSESSNGFTNITDMKANNLFPNFRKENTGDAGAI